MRCNPCYAFPTLLAAIALACAATHAAEKNAPDPLADALEDWIVLVEKDDAKTAAERWASSAESAKAMAEKWPQLKQCHKEYNYRAWLDASPPAEGTGARQIGDAARFTVGGHSFGHLHVVWRKSTAGWRVADVFMCR